MSYLEAENLRLKLHNQNILTCDDCKQRYGSKTEMTNHLRAKHLQEKYKCDECDEYFEDFSNMKLHIQKNHFKIVFKCTECEQSFESTKNMKTHISNKHKKKRYMVEILKKESKMKAQVMEQKIHLYQSLYKLKQKEERQKQKCLCRGLFCRIKHSRYRWTPSYSEIILNELRTTSSQEMIQFNCDECTFELCDEDALEQHKQANHVQIRGINVMSVMLS